MRTTLILAMFTASLAQAGWKDYQETRDLALDAAGITTIEIDAGAGSLEITGLSGADQVTVTAIITVPGKSEEKAQQIIADRLELSLERNGANAVIKGGFDTNGWSFGDSPSIRLEISVPRSVSLTVDDSSGSVTITNVSGDISIDDNSGAIKMSDVGGNVRIVDGSGSIDVEGVGEDIYVDDGSGSIAISHVKGTVTLKDGSGSIDVSDVEKDLIIKNDGSGSIRYSDIRGTVEDHS